MEKKNMKPSISILGCGWLGIPLSTTLLKAGYPVKGSTTSPAKLKELTKLGLHPYVIDLHNRKDRNHFLNADILIIAVPHKNIDNFKFLRTQIKNSQINRLIFISSTSVYPNTNGEVTEKSQTLPTPLANIESIFSNISGIQTTIIRFAGLFGGDRKPGLFFRDDSLIKNPDGFINLIHLDDCIQIIKTLIEKNIWNQVFNACADTHPSRREYYTQEMQKEGRKPPVFDNTKASEYKIVSNDKLKKHLNYQFKHPDLTHFIEPK
ncbi:SDR family oxidoreductase [Saccharicrinis fermentans]|nr:SDR family oxidoreductase [Saccharicrinis fermentans]